jgi:predicted TIM-barrel fold metal-dependent hydrolase
MRCDSHVHIVGPLDRYPQVAERTYQADIATLKQLENVSATRAVRRFVIVQPSFYGVDNSLLLESIDALAGRGRGVGVINPRVTSARTLATYAAQGVRGLRINLYSPLREKAPLTNRFSAIAGIAHELNWHIEVIAPLSMLSENATLLEKSSVPVVIDRYGVYGSLDPARPESRALLKLLEMPHVWIKLSAPYRVSANPLATKPDPA